MPQLESSLVSAWVLQLPELQSACFAGVVTAVIGKVSAIEDWEIVGSGLGLKNTAVFTFTARQPSPSKRRVLRTVVARCSFKICVPNHPFCIARWVKKPALKLSNSVAINHHTANSQPIIPALKKNISGSIEGEAIQKAITGANGTPPMSSAATTGMTPQEQNGVRRFFRPMKSPSKTSRRQT